MDIDKRKKKCKPFNYGNMYMNMESILNYFGLKSTYGDCKDGNGLRYRKFL